MCSMPTHPQGYPQREGGREPRTFVEVAEGRLPYGWVGIEHMISDDRKLFLMIRNDFPPNAYPP